MKLNDFRQIDIAIVVPAYNVESKIKGVIRSIPSYIKNIIVVDDASTDHTNEIIANIAQEDPRITLIQHKKNLGVGGAMVTGFQEALRSSAQIIVKMDGDGQMSVDDLPRLIMPLITGEADYAKGNRFLDITVLHKMPFIRLVGNTALSFIVKAATGYWDCIDPSNGFLAIRRDILIQIPLNKIHHSFFFEISLLSQLYLIDAYIKNIPLPTRYGDEKSHLSILQVLSEFPGRLFLILARRILLKNFLYNFSMESIYLLLGLPMLIFGGIYGGINWIRYDRLGIGAPTGTIMIAVLSIILGFQMLLSAIHLDLNKVPKTPINSGRLE